MSSTSKRGLSEFALIAKLFAPLATAKAAAGLKDDVAVLAENARSDLVLKTDAIVEGVHFLKDDPPETVARKALRVNLSDLAAKGADPVGYLMVLARPAHVTDKWLKAFSAGLKSDQQRFSLSLLGGDTVRMPGPLVIAITAIGRVPKDKAIRRWGAKPGDLVFVTGTIGDAGLGLELLKQKRRSPRGPIEKYRLPQPRLAFGRKLRGLASASIDVSDGLLQDLGHIADVSRVCVEIDAVRVPLSRALQTAWGRDERATLRAASAGDDYEIAFTCRPDRAARVRAAARAAKVPVTQIGEITRGKGVVLLDADGKKIPIGRKGYQHFG
jgi:thiamine-monophosphate kinase